MAAARAADEKRVAGTDDLDGFISGDASHGSVLRNQNFPGKWQAGKWPGRGSASGGGVSAQMCAAKGQRVRKRQPEGGSTALGGSPARRSRSRRRSIEASGIGTAEMR